MDIKKGNELICINGVDADLDEDNIYIANCDEYEENGIALVSVVDDEGETTSFPIGRFKLKDAPIASVPQANKSIFWKKITDSLDKAMKQERNGQILLAIVVVIIIDYLVFDGKYKDEVKKFFKKER